MSESYLLGRLLLHFDSPNLSSDRDDLDDLLTDLSAIASTPDGSLWLGSDEYNYLEQLFPVEQNPHIFAQHQRHFLAEFVELVDDDEVDIEGLDYSEPYLWITGSHSTKRGKVKGKKTKKDIENLAEIKVEKNRCLLARIPIVGGKPIQSFEPADSPGKTFSAATLRRTEKGNLLSDALSVDRHLHSFVMLDPQIPSKENGLDIEGLAVRGDRVFLGLRGPVLRGWAIVLELEVEEQESGFLALKPIGKDETCYRKHFFDLNGMGVRELCWYGEDLLILAGPTMAVEGALRIFRWQDPLDEEKNTVNPQGEKLTVLFDLPFVFGADRAEGLALHHYFGEENSLLVVHDSPDPRRRLGDRQILADVFRLESAVHRR